MNVPLGGIWLWLPLLLTWLTPEVSSSWCLCLCRNRLHPLNFMTLQRDGVESSVTFLDIDYQGKVLRYQFRKIGYPPHTSFCIGQRYMRASSGSSRVMCDNVPGLVSRQRQLCHRHPDVMRAIGLGVAEWTAECQHQFRQHRWNCNTLDRDHSLFGRVLLRSSRESAFVYAVSSAGVVFAITRACSQGELKSCSCDPKKKGSAKDSKGTFDWGGCSDNIDYGIKFARAFVDAKERKGKDARALMNLHNNRAGRKAVKRFLKQECKCHGVSGSCTLRTCWLAMADFRKTGDYLWRKYNGAIQVVMNQDGTGFTVANKRFKKPTKNDLVYFENSPDYCIRDREAGSLGTAGRVCNLTSRGMDSCEVMCCGRGYDTSHVTRMTKCECKFHWCCAVRCQDCLEALDVHTCKAPKSADWTTPT